MEYLENSIKKIKGDSEIVQLMTELISIILEQKKWPSKWETGAIIPIFKKVEKENPENYRQTTLLPVLSKIVTKIKGKKLQDWILANNKISELQAGFKKGYSTIDNLILL